MVTLTALKNYILFKKKKEKKKIFRALKGKWSKKKKNEMREKYIFLFTHKCSQSQNFLFP